MAIKSYELNSGTAFAFCVAIGVLTIAGAFLAAKWGFANTAALKSDTVELAALAVDLGPADPQTHYTLGVLSQKILSADEMERSVTELGAAAALSPNNYVLWFELGRARERNGDQAGSELALRKALELAPNYSRVQWALGNVLLRQGRYDEGFVEIRRAVAGDVAYTNPAASTALEIFDGDVAAVREAIGGSHRANAALATLLIGRKRFDESFEIWDRLPPQEKTTALKETGAAIYRQYFEAGQYRLASRIGEQIGISSNGRETIGEIINGGFEDPLVARGPDEFIWQVSEGTMPRIGPTEGQKHSGSYSLLLAFNPPAKGIRQVSQNVAVVPGANYVLEFFVRSELVTKAKFKWEIVTTANGNVIGSTNEMAVTSDWALSSTEFTVPMDADGVTIRLLAAGCDPANCTISGNIWFDDFTLRAGNE